MGSGKDDIGDIVAECLRTIPEELGPFRGTVEAGRLSDRTDMTTRQMGHGLGKLHSAGYIEQVATTQNRAKYIVPDEDALESTTPREVLDRA